MSSKNEAKYCKNCGNILSVIGNDVQANNRDNCKAKNPIRLIMDLKQTSETKHRTNIRIWSVLYFEGIETIHKGDAFVNQN